MRIVDIRERSVAISRYRDPAIPSGGLTTSVVAVVTDVLHSGQPVVGYGFASIGRFAQGGLIRERFAPRLLAAPTGAITDEAGLLDPVRAWRVMMAGEKPGGHGERCVAVGTLDMALWDAAAKIAGLPLHRFLDRYDGFSDLARTSASVPAYASGGYRYPDEDLARLNDELRHMQAQGFTRFKIKIGAGDLESDLRRIEQALDIAGRGNLAVDAMNVYGPDEAHAAAAALEPYGLWWFEDVCDPLDFDTWRSLSGMGLPLAAGEALFSTAEARLLARHGGLRPERDILVFDPVHCYGLPGYVEIIREMKRAGWQAQSFWPHGGHLFSVHVAAALGLGGCETNPVSFLPFSRLPDGLVVEDGNLSLPELPGIGFEAVPELSTLYSSLLAHPATS